MESLPWCSGELKGDPDIAGIGVVTSIMTTTGSAVLLSWLLWYLALVKGKTAKNSKLYLALIKSAYAIADIQLVTALSITCAAMILIQSDSETSLYHIFVARCLAQANFTGYGAALAYDTRSQTNWSWRVGLLLISVVIYWVWTWMTIHEFAAWDPEQPSHTPQCFYNDSTLPFSYITWMYIDLAWFPLGWAWVFFQATGKWKHDLIRFNFITARFLLGTSSGGRRGGGGGGGAPRPTPTTNSAGLGSLLRGALTRLLKLLAYFVIAITICPPATAPFASTLFFIWSTFDIWWVRAANAPILVTAPDEMNGLSMQGSVNAEDDWGFGQILPLMLLLLPVLQITDIFSETGEKERRHSVYITGDAMGSRWAEGEERANRSWYGWYGRMRRVASL